MFQVNLRIKYYAIVRGTIELKCRYFAFFYTESFFNTPKVKLIRFAVTPRGAPVGTSCCSGRYAGVQLIADSKTVAKTPNPNIEKDTFDMLEHANGEPLVGKEFKLDWSQAPNGHAAQVEWIEISYQKLLRPTSDEDAVQTWSGDDGFGTHRANGFSHQSYPLSNLFDGNKDSIYISRTHPFVAGAYVDVDFAKPVVIDEIVLTTRTNYIWDKERLFILFRKQCLKLLRAGGILI